MLLLEKVCQAQALKKPNSFYLVFVDASTSHYHSLNFFLGSPKFKSVVLSCKPKSIKSPFAS